MSVSDKTEPTALDEQFYQDRLLYFPESSIEDIWKLMGDAKNWEDALKIKCQELNSKWIEKKYKSNGWKLDEEPLIETKKYKRKEKKTQNCQAILSR